MFSFFNFENQALEIKVLLKEFTGIKNLTFNQN